jgi:hypothetical protein
MFPAKFLEVLQTLKTGTEKNRLMWQDLPDEEMFRTPIAGGLVRIGKIKDGVKTGYTFFLTGNTGSIAAELEFWPGDEGYELIQDIYTSARLAARGGTQMIDMIIMQGKAWK